MNKTFCLESMLPFVSKASRYLGNEINAIKKDPDKVQLRFALAFPDAYEVGMSYLGLQLLYHVLNSRSTIACERVFAPWPDMEALMRQEGLKLATLESRLPVRDCDIVGFSLEYELSYATALRMLSLAGIPLQTAERTEAHSLVIAGGPATYNPEPIAEFFDAIVIGEGEDVVLEICDAMLAWRKKKAPRSALLHALSEIQGVYVPSLFNVAYHPDGTLRDIIPLKPGYSEIRKRIITGFSDAPCCTAPVVPYMQVIHDRAGLEIARGCSRGCRFCMAGMIYRPVREKDIARVRRLAAELLANTGYEDLSLASLSAGDFTNVGHLLQLLMKDHADDRVAISFPSLRAETLSRGLMEEIKRVRKTGFTIAPEAGTQRLRDVINKNLSEEEILAAASRIFGAGWNLVKLYFMIGLPTETRDDLEGIVALSNKIASIARGRQVNVSVSSFVPKPHTPFQWVQQEAAEAILAKQLFLKRRLSARNIRLKWHNHHLTLLEGVFARGDRRLARVLVHAVHQGAGFEGWTEHFKPAVWEQAFEACGIERNFYLRRRDIKECLPWSRISCGITAEFLRSELDKAYHAETTPDCRRQGCTSCGVCNALAARPEMNQPAGPEPAARSQPRDLAPVDAIHRYRLCYSKTGTSAFLSHLELCGVFSRALRRARLPLRYSQGFHPLPRIIVHEALPVGMEASSQTCDIELFKNVNAADLPDIINARLPEGLAICSAEESAGTTAGDAAATKKYAIYPPENSGCRFPPAERLRDLIAAFHDAGEYVMQSVKKGASFQTDLKPLVSRLNLTDDCNLKLELKNTSGRMPHIPDIVGAILHLGEREKRLLKIIKL